MCFSHGRTQVVRDFTRVCGNSKSALDLFFLSHSIVSKYYRVDILPEISDHSTVRLFLNTGSLSSVPRNVSCYRQFNEADDTLLIDELALCFE